MPKAKVATIGFTKTSAENFFHRLSNNNIKKILDVRLNSTSQLSGFAKSEDLAFFLKNICAIEYVQDLTLAPTEGMLRTYKKEKGDWHVYEKRFLDLIAERKIEDQLRPDLLDGTCLLCSEATPHHCHRRLVLDYLNRRWDGALDVRHL